MHDILNWLHDVLGLSEQVIRLLQVTVWVVIPVASAVITAYVIHRAFLKGNYLDEIVASRNFLHVHEGKETLVMATIATGTLGGTVSNPFLRRKIRRRAGHVTREFPALRLGNLEAHRQMMRRFYNLVSPAIPHFAGPQLMMPAVEDALQDLALEEHKIRPLLISEADLKKFLNPDYVPALMDPLHELRIHILRHMAKVWDERKGILEDGRAIVVVVYPPWTK